VAADSDSRLLHLGCGLNAAPGWLNIDGSWSAWVARRPWLKAGLGVFGVRIDAAWSRDIVSHDLRNPLPLPDGRFTGVYASHVLEHLYFEEAQRLLKECHRVLEPGGVLRVVVPDLAAIIGEYADGKGFAAAVAADTPADRVNLRLLMHSADAPSLARRLFRVFCDFHSHKWMYDTASLSFHLQQAGFHDIHPCALYDSRLVDIKAVERPDRILGGEGICLEARK